MWHELAHLMGLDNLSGPWYGFWSGIGSDLGEVTLLGALVMYARHHNCHATGCWRLGHPHEGVVHCRKHREAS